MVNQLASALATHGVPSAGAVSQALAVNTAIRDMV